MNLPDHIRKKLEQRKIDNKLRNLEIPDELVDFQSNDYLGMARMNIHYDHSLFTGSGGSRLISGNHEYYVDLENFLSEQFESEDAIVFNSGYDANLGFFSSVPQRNECVIYDEYIHASVRDGVRLGMAKGFSFEHNNVQSLEHKLERSVSQAYVVVESVYSMDGDIAPLQEIQALCSKYNAMLIIDEAHAAGIFGDGRKGLAHGMSDVIRLLTFGKAFGRHAAAFLLPEELKHYLVNFARSLIYSTALPPSALNASHKAIAYVLRSDKEAKELRKNISFYNLRVNELQIPDASDNNSPVQYVLFHGNENVKEAASVLSQNGFALKAIKAPTVPAGYERLRISLHAYNDFNQINDLLVLIKQLKNES